MLRAITVYTVPQGVLAFQGYAASASRLKEAPLILKQRELGARAPQLPEPRTQVQPLYTRYCAAPKPAHPVGEPSYLHALRAAAWLCGLGRRQDDWVTR